MAFFIKQDENWYLKDTGIENIFINEYMTQAPGDYVKIYILALMYAKMGADISNEAIAKSVGVEEEDVLKAWNYWESQGAVIKHKKRAQAGSAMTLNLFPSRQPPKPEMRQRLCPKKK